MDIRALRIWTGIVVMAMFSLAGCGGGASPSAAPVDAAQGVLLPDHNFQIRTLSNRADLISGGEALVEVQVPKNVPMQQVTLTLNGVDVGAAFTSDAQNRTMRGLVTGLVVGQNTFVADSNGVGNGRPRERLTITNHPKGGPVLLGAQTQPWICATPTAVPAAGNTPASNASGLSTTATDAQCNIATEYRLWYRTRTAASVAPGDGGCQFVRPDPSPAGTATPAASCFQPYVPGTTPAASVAITTTSHGVTVPYIVRVERGTINRGIYDIAVLFDPTQPDWTGVHPQPQWNGKVLYTYGASTGQPRQQFRSEQNWAVGFLGAWDDTALRQGFLVVDNSVTDSLYNSNRVLTAETTMMMKEHIVDRYGEIKYTMSNGCSGGSIQQNTVASIFPGLLDGIQPSCDYPDSITTGTEVIDCVLLVNLYVKPQWTALMTGLTQAQINAKKAAINGHRDQLGCHGWNNSFGTNNKPGNFVPVFVIDATGTLLPVGAPRNNCLLPTSQVYDPVTNPNGPRCGDADLSAAVWGTTAGIPPGSRRALTTNDNVGVQYGYKALLSGAITPEEFVVLNENIGGTDVDFNLSASRSVADAAALPIAYRAGIVASGKNLGKVAIIDSRGFDEGPTAAVNIHFNWRSFEERARLDSQADGHPNQVIWRYGTGLLPATAPQIAAVTTRAFTTMDTWLSQLLTIAPKDSLNAARTQAQVVAAKPAGTVDFCFLTADVNFTTPIFDQAVCDADPNLKVYASPHQVAGGPQEENILKCALKPLVFTDYPGIAFTSAQKTRLNAVFPNGVCDWTQPGVGQQDPVSPLNFASGPGGVPLGPEPVAVPF